MDWVLTLVAVFDFGTTKPTLTTQRHAASFEQCLQFAWEESDRITAAGLAKLERIEVICKKDNQRGK